MVGVVHGSYGPGDSYPQEHVDCVTPGHVSNGVIRGAVLDSGHLAGERVYEKYMTVSTFQTFFYHGQT